MNWVRNVAGALFCASLSACVTAPSACKIMDSRDDWSNLDNAPRFVDADVIEAMYVSGKPPEADELIWYKSATGRVAACNPGNRYGCGDHVVFYDEVNGSYTRSDLEEIVVCGG